MGGMEVSIMDLRNKRVLFLGSSVTYGYRDSGISFADYMVKHCGLVMVKEAVCGTTLADIAENSYVSRLKRLDPGQNFDLAICQLSTNDAALSLPREQTEKAIRDIIAYVRHTFDCPVMFYTGTYFESENYANLVALLLSLQKELDYYVLDLWNDPDMRAIPPKDYALYMADPIHPNLLGYEQWWLPKFIDFCQNI